MSVPTVSFLDAMEAGRYQQASQDKGLVEQAEEGDALARAFLVTAEVHRDAATRDLAGCVGNAKRAIELLRGDAVEGWARKALVQHLEQCIEYVREGKPLPELPSGL